jgi:hypothetical protein
MGRWAMRTDQVPGNGVAFDVIACLRCITLTIQTMRGEDAGGTCAPQKWDARAGSENVTID